MPTNNSDSIPGLNEHQLAAVADDFLVIPDVWADAADRFVSEVRKLVEQRAQNGWPNERDEDIAVFVLVDHPREVGELHGATAFVDPIAKEDPILGQLYFTSPNASAGRAMAIPAESNAVLEWLEDNHLGDRPIVIVYRNSLTMSVRPKGIEGDPSNQKIRDRKPTATQEWLENTLEWFHPSVLLTPSVCPEGVWETGRARDYVPGRRPEKAIQYALGLVLATEFAGVLRVKREDPVSIGRIDLKLLKKEEPGSGYSYWAILELKVIKSFRNAARGTEATRVNDSENVESIIEGVRQAGSFAENCNIRGFLEIYDLRKNKAVDLIARQEVSREGAQFNPPPKIHVWKMFGSAQDARNARYTGVERQ